MSYYSRFELVEITNTDYELELLIIQELRNKYSSALRAINWEGKTEDTEKWYGFEEQLCHFSKEYPDCTFIFYVKGEDNEDLRRYYFRNGKVVKQHAQIVFSKFNPNEFKEVEEVEHLPITSKDFHEYEEQVKKETVDYYSTFKIGLKGNKKDNYTKEELFERIFSKGYNYALSFLLSEKMKDKNFQKQVQISQKDIEKMIKKAIKKHQTK